MKLTAYEQDMLDGKFGRFKQIALENVLKYAKVVGAEELVEVTKATLYFGAHPYLDTAPGNTYDEIFSRMYLCTDEKVPLGEFEKSCFCQSCCSACEQYGYEKSHLSKEIFDKNNAYLQRTLEAGCCIAGSCTPYLNGWVPLYGECVVTSESSNIVMSNSAFGARCNADGEEAITWIAICGRAPKWGYYVTENRYGDCVFHLECKSETSFDWDLIGYTIGRMLPAAGVPIITGDFHRPTLIELKQCFASLATTSAAEICHVVGVTPEARTLEDARGNKPLRGEFTITQKDIEESYRKLTDAGDHKINSVMLGCPHYNLQEIQRAALYLKGKKVSPGVELQIWTDMSTKEMARVNGFEAIINEAGGDIMCSTCWNNLDAMAHEHITGFVTDGAKEAHYMRSNFNGEGREVPVFFGDYRKCIDTAVSGIWKEE